MFGYAHDRASEISSSETSGDDVPVIDPPTTHESESPAATLSSHTGSPDLNTQADSNAPSQHSMVLDPTSTAVSWCEPPSALTAVMGEISPSLTPDLDSNIVEVAALVQLPKYRKKPEVSPRGCQVVQARASCTATTTRQTCKRKIDSCNDVNADKENITISLSHHDTPVIKCICREKSGTDWQSVLDIIEYGEEQ
ncbi:uncharacterized protein EDB91DRAFT_1078556 [Suillus paluster]|uniref:uncharacterized protein n=1 Tax=Suillus paluster TaxID=48578 RepID=UPI001B85E194|nr:uncharacterized protein EDB91DRAFT_1078556 [Suillus paluster]KAG1750536.1 hypothetical protein EDB91DRAFT_1078556 [Suillus paluster]